MLVQNALNYGRLPGEPARIRLRVFQVENKPMIDVLDRGPVHSTKLAESSDRSSR